MGTVFSTKQTTKATNSRLYKLLYVVLSTCMYAYICRRLHSTMFLRQLFYCFFNFYPIAPEGGWCGVVMSRPRHNHDHSVKSERLRRMLFKYSSYNNLCPISFCLHVLTVSLCHSLSSMDWRNRNSLFEAKRHILFQFNQDTDLCRLY